MVSIGIYYGSTTGNTECAALKIGEALGTYVSGVWDIHRREAEELLESDVLLFGCPTWHIGELQDDWYDFLPKIRSLDLTGKKVGFFGLGDSWGYGDNFLDALGLLWEEIAPLGKPELIGVWPTAGYDFEASKGLFDEKHFVGLGLDEDNEPHLHETRIRGWTNQLLRELGLPIVETRADEHQRVASVG